MPDPRDYVDEDYTYVRGYVRRKRRTSGSNISLFGLLVFLVVIGVILWIIKTFWIIFSVIAIIGLAMFIILKWRKWRLVSIWLGIIVLGACISIFILEKVPSTTLVNALQVDKLTGSQTLSGYSATVQIEPNLNAIANRTYLLKLNNGITELEYLVTWNQLELDTHKVKSFTKGLSSDERTAWETQPNFKVAIYEMIPRHNFIYLFVGVFVFAGLLSLAIFVYPRVFLEY